MLLRLGLSGEGKEGEHVSILSTDPISIKDVFKEIHKLNGLVIAPHVDNHDGIWGGKDFSGRTEILNSQELRILAAPSGDIKCVEEGSDEVRFLYKNMDTTKILNSYAFINVADCHRVEDFEVNTTWLKMSAPSLEGVRQIIFEPELRIAHKIVETGDKKVQHPKSFHFTSPAEPTHPYVIGLSVTGGMLDGQTLAFSPHQNSIIGKNYAGKSAVLDCLRFALNTNLQGDNYHKYVDRLRAIVTDGGQVRVYFRGLDNRLYGVSRVLTCTKLPGGGNKWNLEGASEVFLLIGDEFRRQSDMTVEDVINLEVFPQGEVVKIKDDITRQMSIVDSLARLQNALQALTNDDSEDQRTIRGRLVDNGKEILRLLVEQEKLIEDTSDFDQLQNEIGELEDLIKSPLFGEMQRWTDVDVLISRYQSELAVLETLWGNLTKDNIADTAENDIADLQETEENNTGPLNGIVSNTFDPDTASPDEFEQHAKSNYERIRRYLLQVGKSAQETIKQLSQSLEVLETHARKRCEGVQTEITKKAGSDSTAIETNLMERIAAKKRRSSVMQSKRGQLERLATEIAQAQAQRATLLETYQQAWADVRRRRLSIVELINLNSPESIQAELLEARDNETYRRVLEQIANDLTSSAVKISGKQAQLDIIADKVTPQQLINAVRSGDSNQLVAMAPGLSPNTAKIFIAMTEAHVHVLELCVLGDKFVISYRKQGDRHFTPIDGALSGGEQALAMISVAMIPKHLPLVIDQPEDELGPALITTELVDQIRNVKPIRQLIFVTHIPNIPVLADSEQIVYIEQHITGEYKTSHVKYSGSLDDGDIVRCLLDLDGGPVAFSKRNARYSPFVRQAVTN